MKKIISSFLAFLLVLSFVPTAVNASDKIVITEIKAYFDFTLPSYGDAIDRTPFEITVEGDIPVVISTESFDWYIENNDELKSVKNGYFTDGLWCFDVNVNLTNEEDYTFDYINGTTLIINDVVWSTDIIGGWEYSPQFEIEYEAGAIPLALYSVNGYTVPTNYIGEAIEPYDFSICAIGGTKPYTFSKSGGSEWLQISENGILSGTPVTAGENDQIYITVTDALGAEAHLTVDVENTYIHPDDRTVISRVEATVDFPEFYCGYTRTTAYESNVTVGIPATISTGSSDFYPVDNEGNRGSSTRTLSKGKYILDLMVKIEEDGHNYVLDENNLEVFINGEATVIDSFYIAKDHSYVWVTTSEFTVDHAFDNDTDATCNGCDYVREGCDHQYDNACDASCNICSATRVTNHEYDAICDDECNVCKEKREAEPHTFSGCNDSSCDICSFYRSTPTHTYDDCFDSICNICETTRNVPVHTYSNFSDTTCNSCGETRTINTISLNENKTAIVEVGGTLIEYIFTPTITGEFVFESFSTSDTYGYILDENGNELWRDDDSGDDRQFKIQQNFEAGKTYILELKFFNTEATGEIPFSIACVHDFVDNCDNDCGICGLVRQAPHSYDNAVDAQCNECENIRELNFIEINETKTVEITKDTEYVDFVFVPEISGKYSFIGLGNESQDTYATILDSEENQLITNDQSGGNNQFKITYEMEAGKTYILRACFYNSSVIGTFPVALNCEHAYDDECDSECNICSTLREAPHNFTNGCDADCNNCGETRTPEEHKYTNCEDAGCNICGAGRETVHCVWDNCFDSVCNVCEYERITPSHIYDNHIDTTCNSCGAERELEYINLGETKNFTLQEGETALFVFVCEVSGRYAFSSSFAELKDSFGSIHLIDDKELDSNDDSGAESRQFYLEYDFQAGTTYILKASFYSENLSGDGSVSFFCVEHTYSDENDDDCNACGFIREIEKELNVICNSEIDFTVVENILNAKCELACKVGYLENGEYISIEGTKNSDSSYSFEIPTDITEVVLLINGDVNNDGVIDSTDYLRIKGHFLGTYTLEGAALLAGDVNNDSAIDSTDYLRIKGHFLRTYTIEG